MMADDFYKWMEPQDAYIAALKVMPKGSAVWESKNRYILELISLARFAIGYELLTDKMVQIRLSKEEPADGQIGVDSKVLDFQICEVLDEGRQRHREYKEWEKKGRTDVEPYSPVSQELALRWIVNAIKKKDQRYFVTTPLYLLAYIDFDYQGMRLDQITAAVKSASLKSFSEVWLIGSCWSKVGDGAVIGRAYPDQWGFLPFVPAEKRVIGNAELGEPFDGWKSPILK